MVSGAIEAIRTGGYRGPITTPALTPDETTGFRSAGFHEVARLHLFRLDLQQPIPPSHGTSDLLLRRLPRLTRRQDQWIDAALAVDGAAFAVGERFDHLSIDEALNATPRRQVRFVVDPSPGSRPGSPASSPPLVDGRTVVAYAITGRAGHRGYLQRLAVHPAYQGRGVGALLCADAIAWARTGRAQVLAVNTREDNARAVRLYTRVGFEPVSGGLTVLGIPGSDGPL
jgi:ribosomal protein S18 acetylase RimI-like enzyme